MSVPVEHGFASVDGVRYHFLKAGSGPALILVHGLIGTAQNWEPVLEALAGIRTVYAIDMANMGESERVPGLAAGLEAAARTLAGFMDALGLAEADIAGHSHGGAVVMMLAAMHPERLRRMVLVAPANPFSTAGHDLIRFYTTPFGTWLVRRIPSMPRAVHHWAHKRMYVDKSKATPEALKGYEGGLNRHSIEHVLLIIRSWHQDMAQLEQRLPIAARVPSLLLWGEQDGAVSISSAQRLHEVLRGSLVTFPRVGHIPFAERTAECRDAMVRWYLAT